MAFDTRYRPVRFEDVLGQKDTSDILKQYIASGHRFHQSYLFCGPFGSGKTTLARILGRALLCENPVNGEPCDRCSSCCSMLETGSADGFLEFDAATNSGKDDIKDLTELNQYDTFSGRRRVFLMDEAHRLSKSALDALLKPMEESVPNSDDKRLIAIFCTTEPEKMAPTIFSRCAPRFVIQRITPEDIADRLAHICQVEKIGFEREALVFIAEGVECHVRDAFKALEAISLSGDVTLKAVNTYLRLDANNLYVGVIWLLGRDISRVLRLTEKLFAMVSPGTMYAALADICMLAYRHGLGVGRLPAYWKSDPLLALWRGHGQNLPRMAALFSSRPAHPTLAMLQCDLTALHHNILGGDIPSVATSKPEQTLTVQASAQHNIPQKQTNSIQPTPDQPGRVAPQPSVKPGLNASGVYVDLRAVNNLPDEATDTDMPPLAPEEFRRLLHRQMVELNNRVGGKR